MTAFTHLAPLAAAALAAAIWQSALLALCVAAGLRLLPGITAAARSLLWSAVFFLTLALPFVRFTFAGSSAGPASTSLRVDSRWALAVAALWAVLSVVRVARLVRSAVLLYRVSSQSEALAAPTEIAVLLSGAKVSLCTSTLVDVPSVAGFFHRRILLPPSLVGQIAPADLHGIVLHELEHLRRRDDWTNLLQKLVLALFPLNPVLLWVERRLCLERELACDDGVLHATHGAAKAYATCLTNLAEQSLLRRGLFLALGAWQRQPELARRVHRILRNPVREMRAAQSAALAILSVAAAVGTGALAVKAPPLITFMSAPVAEDVAASAPVVHPTLVKSILPHPRSVPATLSVSRRRIPRHRTLIISTGRYAATPNVVLIGWRPGELRASHWVAASPVFQLTYAAVPTRTGWLFFQL